MVDVFSTDLQECSWRGISFPIELVGEKGSQTMAVHHRMDRDVARVEPTGRQSYNFTVKAFFLTDLTPGQNETWSDLFPATWLAVKAALENRSSGIFVHPMYGNINCLPVDWSVDYTADIRDGVIAQIEFIETTSDTDVNTVQLDLVSITSSATSAASTMDSQLSSAGLPADSINTVGQPSTSDAVSFILAQPAPQAQLYIGVMTNSLYDFVTTLSTYPDSYAPLVDTSYQLIQSLQGLIFTFQQQQLTTGVYITANTLTLASIANFTSNSVENIMLLNPGLVEIPLIPPNTNVLYYIP